MLLKVEKRGNVMVKVKGVIFDMDGLMFDSEKIAFQTNIAAAKQFGYDLPEHIASQLIGRNVDNSFAYLRDYFGQDYPCEKIRACALKMREEHYQKHPLEMKKGLVELLDTLKKKHIKMAVASSTRTEKIMKNLTDANILHYFDYIVGGEQEVNGKPAPDIFLNACHGLKIKSHEALVLEDSLNGILAANNAHIRVICIPDIIHHSQDIIDKTYLTLSSLDEVIDYVE